MTSPPASNRPGSESSSPTTAARLSEVSSESLPLAKASERLIQSFGGIRPMANKLEVPVTTVQGWKKRGAIPATRLPDLRTAAQRHGIVLEEADLDAVGGSDERPAEAPRLVPVAAAPEPAIPEPVIPAAPVDVTVAPPVATKTPAPPEPAPAPVNVAPVLQKPAAAVPPLDIPLRPSVGMALRSAQMTSASSSSAPVPPAAVAAAAARLAAAAVPVASSAGNRLMALGPARLSMAAAVVALLAAGIAVWSTPSVPSPAGSEAGMTPAAERRLGDLETKVSRVALDQGSQTAAIEKQITALDTRVAQSAGRKSVDDLAVRIATLEKDLPALQQRVASQGIGAPVLGVLLSATQLRGVLASTSPYVNELAALRLTGFNDPALKQSLDQISSRAQTGIATEAWLIGRFSTVQGNILRAASIGNPAARVADLFLDTLSDWVPPVYRLTGVSEGATPRALADRAQAAMAAGEFARAVELMGELTGLPAEVAAPWLAEARARVIADRARTQLAKLMLAIAQPGGK